MKIREGTARVLEIVAVLALVLLLAGNLLGQPVLLGFVTSGSMEPTIAEGDGFIAIPSAVAGPIESGDIVVFEARRLNGGGLTTHRVVRETERGYVTKGDANPFTDQDGDEPPVKDAQVVATVLQVGGEPIVVPALGKGITAARDVFTGVGDSLSEIPGTGSGLFVALPALALLLTLFFDEDPGRERSRSRERDDTIDTTRLVLLSALALVLATTAGMVVPAGTTTYGVVSAQTDAPGPRVIPTGETETTTYRAQNGGVLPVQVFLSPASDGVAVSNEQLRVEPRSTANATLSLTAPEQTGFYRRFVTEHRYLAVLPPPVIERLYTIHPWVPLLVIDGIVVTGYLTVAAVVVGRGGTIRPRNRSRSRTGSRK
jgi:signal peptidase